MWHQKRGGRNAGDGVRETTRDQVDTDGDKGADDAVGPSRGREIGLIGHVAVTPVPVRTEVEVVKPVGVEITPLQGQSEAHQVRPKRRLANHELALSPELTGRVAQLFEEARAMHPARLVTVELRCGNRTEIDPESNEENQSSERDVPAREHRF